MKKKILLKGPLLTRSGYGEQARYALRSLRSKSDIFDIYIQPITWGSTSWIAEDNEERAWIDQAIEKTISFMQQGGNYDISLQVTIPPEFEQIAPVNIGYTAGIETTKAHHQWIQKGNLMDKIIFISNHSKNVFNNSKYPVSNNQTGEQGILENKTELCAINYPVKTFEQLPELDLELTTDFNFLTVAQYSIRKNLENTIKWFVEEFADENVGLVVKTNMAKNCLMDREMIFNKLRELVNSVNSETKCKVYLLHGDMTDDEIHALYTHPKLNAMVCLPHGEGFGLPLFEAHYSGMPIVTVGWSGQLDFLIDEEGNENFYSVSYDVQPVQKEAVWDGVIMADSMWAYARESSAKKNMRQCYNDCTNGEGIALKAKEVISEVQNRFNAEKMYDQFSSAVYDPSDEESQWLDNLSKIEIL
tara:strand:+ start:1825 stop:3075 length:1251 start_codon:yes stop_codon:yes gene_type:complete